MKKIRVRTKFKDGTTDQIIVPYINLDLLLTQFDRDIISWVHIKPIEESE